MIETDEQRRWWFATHPEYSWSHRKAKAQRQREKDRESRKFSPEEIDAYVDTALKYVDGSVADLLKSTKRNFGTEGDSWEGEQDPGASAGVGEDGWLRVAGYHADGGAFMPRLPIVEELFRWPEQSARKFFQWLDILLQDSPSGLEREWRSILEGYYADGGAFMPRVPTTEELSRWPKETARGFLRWVDELLQNNPLVIDPNSLERHHGLPKEFVKYFLDCGIRIDDFIIIMRAGDHRLKPDGLHTGKGRGGNWNREWEDFIKYHPAANTQKRQDQIHDKLEEMIKKYELNKKAILLPKIPKRR